MMSNTVPKNGNSAVDNKPDIARLVNCQEKLRMIMASMASRAHSYYWKMLDDKEDSLPALLNISLSDVKSVYHLCGIYDKDTGNFNKKQLEIFMSTMDRAIIETVNYTTLSHKKSCFFVSVI